MNGYNCCCSSEACREHGCQQMPANKAKNRSAGGASAWWCPGCGAYHAPHVETCPSPHGQYRLS